MVSSTLDYESRVRYFLTVIASDHGSPSLSSTAAVHIDLIDSNDVPPEITITTVNSDNFASVSLSLRALLLPASSSITSLTSVRLDYRMIGYGDNFHHSFR